MERPMLVLGARGSKSDDATSYANVEALAQLRDAVDKVLKGEKVVSFSAVAENRNWHSLTVSLSNEADFSSGEDACKCGCQNKYTSEEAKYKI